MNVDHNVSKTIECKNTEFHTKLITDVLEGFVGLTPNIYGALEKILTALSKTFNQSSSSADTKTIICERYEYVSEAKMIRSCKNQAGDQVGALANR